jgi:ubiquinone/menaquinone biosynthesis C-methylase UbiE
MSLMNPERSERHFDRWAPRYDRSVHQKLMFGPVHDAALSAFSAFGAAPRDILDVGCGTGRLLEAAGRRWGGARLVGIDASEGMIAEARHKHDGDARFTFEKGDASRLPLEDASFDAVFSTVSFHHWGDQAGGLREVARVMRPGGLFVLADIKMPFLFILRRLFNRGDRANFLGGEAIRRLLEQPPLSILMERRFWSFSRFQLFVARKNSGT